MSFRRDAFYVCTGKPALGSNEQIADPELRQFLTERLLFKRSVHDRTAWTDGDSTTLVKLLILAKFKKFYDNEFLSAAPVSVEFFDRWWALERLELEEDFDDIEDQLLPNVIESFVPTGNKLVDSLFENLRRNRDSH